MICLSCTKWIPQICERCRKPEIYDSEIDRLRARIADLEAAGRLLGAECRTARYHYPEAHWPQDEVAAARNATDAHPTAAGFVKEAGDGH